MIFGSSPVKDWSQRYPHTWCRCNPAFSYIYTVWGNRSNEVQCALRVGLRKLWGTQPMVTHLSHAQKLRMRKFANGCGFMNGSCTYHVKYVTMVTTSIFKTHAYCLYSASYSSTERHTFCEWVMNTHFPIWAVRPKMSTKCTNLANTLDPSFLRGYIQPRGIWPIYIHLWGI